MRYYTNNNWALYMQSIFIVVNLVAAVVPLNKTNTTRFAYPFLTYLYPTLPITKA